MLLCYASIITLCYDDFTLFLHNDVMKLQYGNVITLCYNVFLLCQCNYCFMLYHYIMLTQLCYDVIVLS